MSDMIPRGAPLPAASRPPFSTVIRAGMPGRVTVFEVVNRKRRERYLTCTGLPMVLAIAEFTSRLPTRVAHWRGDRRLQFHSLEFDLNPEEACDLVARQARECAAAGWRCLRDLAGGSRPKNLG